MRQQDDMSHSKTVVCTHRIKKKLARPRPISVMMSAIRWQLGWICTL